MFIRGLNTKLTVVMYESKQAIDLITGAIHGTIKLDGLPAGEFVKLRSPAIFRSSKLPELIELVCHVKPDSLQEAFRYPEWEEHMVPLGELAVKRANTVLGNVMAKAGQHDQMDAQTKQMLWPSMVCEGFAHIIQGYFEKRAASNLRQTAPSAADDAGAQMFQSWNLIEESTASTYKTDSYVLAPLYSPSWASVLQENCRRYGLSSGEAFKHWRCIVVNESTSDQYAAITDWIQRMVALRFEFSRHSIAAVQTPAQESFWVLSLEPSKTSVARKFSIDDGVETGFVHTTYLNASKHAVTIELLPDSEPGDGAALAPAQLSVQPGQFAIVSAAQTCCVHNSDEECYAYLLVATYVREKSG